MIGRRRVAAEALAVLRRATTPGRYATVGRTALVDK
jgi:hypothetical protein